MKFAILCLVYVFKIAVDASVFNSSVLESRFLGGFATSSVVKYVASVGIYRQMIIGRKKVYNHNHVCSAFLITNKHLASSFSCQEKLSPHKANNYEYIRALIGEHEINFNEFTPISENYEGQYIQGSRSIAVAQDYSNEPSFYGVTFIYLKNKERSITHSSPCSVPIYPGIIYFGVGWARQRMENFPGPPRKTHRLVAAIFKICPSDECQHFFHGNQYNETYIACGSGLEQILKSKTMPEDYGAPVLDGNYMVIGMTIPSSASRNSPNYFLKIEHITRLFPFLEYSLRN